MLNHSLATAPVSLFDNDGSARKTSKNKLALILMSKSNKENADASEENTMYVVDLMALMRVVMAIPETFEDLALMLTSILLNQRISTSRLGCKLLLWISICRESKERFCNKDIIKPPKPRVPRDFSNEENKTCVTELIFEAIKEKRLHLLNVLRDDHMNKSLCHWS